MRCSHFEGDFLAFLCVNLKFVADSKLFSRQKKKRTPKCVEYFFSVESSSGECKFLLLFTYMISPTMLRCSLCSAEREKSPRKGEEKHVLIILLKLWCRSKKRGTWSCEIRAFSGIWSWQKF